MTWLSASSAPHVRLLATSIALTPAITSASTAVTAAWRRKP